MKKDLEALRIDRSRKSGSQGNRPLFLVLGALLLMVLTAATTYYFVAEPAAQATSDTTPEGDVSAESKSPGSTRRTPSPGREVLVASGYIVPDHRISLGSKVMGRVAWMGVDKGDRVKKGELLVKLEDSEYQAQLAQAQAQLQSARSRLEEFERGSRPEEIGRAEAELARAQAEAENARLEHRRLSGLVDEGIASRQDTENAAARFEMAEAAVDVARRSLELFQQGPREEQVAQARAEVSRAQAQVDYHQALLDATEIRAPVSGTVLARIAEVGEMITTSFAGEQGAKSSVVSLADLNDLQVELDISQTDFNRISSEQECTMIPEAYPDRKYACEIDEISPEADRQKATIEVKVRILDPDSFLRPEMSARVIFSEREQADEQEATG